MPIQVGCPHCGRNYRLKDELAGKKFRCNECQEVVTAPVPDEPTKQVRDSRPQGNSESRAGSREKSVPAGEEPRSNSRPSSRSSSGGNVRRETSSASDSSRKPGKTKRRSKPDPEPEYEHAEDELPEFDSMDSYSGDDTGWNDPYDHEDPYATEPAPKSSPRSRKSSSGSKSSKSRGASGSGWSLGFNIGRLNIAMVVIGFSLLMIGGMEMSLSRKSNATPVPVSLADLLQNGPGSNVYFTVSGIQPASDEFVYEERGGTRKSYNKVYYACQPFGVGNASPVRFVVLSTKSKDDFAVSQLMGQSTHTGMIINSIRRLGSEERQLLQSAAPGANLIDAMIFEVDRHPSSAIQYLSLITGGMGLLLGGLAWIFVRRS